MGKAFFICDICIVLTSIFTLEWYLFNQPNLNIFALSLGDVFLSFLYPIADLLFLLLGVSLFSVQQFLIPNGKFISLFLY